MKATGIVRRVDDLGRVVIPKEIRRSLDIGAADSLEIYVDGDDIILRKYQPGCALCGSMDGLVEVDGALICRECAEKINQAAKGGKA